MKNSTDLGIDIVVTKTPIPSREEGFDAKNILAGKYDDLVYAFGVPWRRGEKAKLARTVGVSRQYITELTSGRRKASPQMAARLSRAALDLNIWGISPKVFTEGCSGPNAKFNHWDKRWQLIQKQKRGIRKQSFLPMPDEAIQIKSELLVGYRDAIKNPQSCLNRYAKRLRRLIRQARFRLAELQPKEDTDNA